VVDHRERDTGRSIRRVSPSEAKSLLDLGYFYVDVRSVEEFHDRHPKGALNVPIAARMTGNAPLAAASSAEMGAEGPSGAAFLDAMRQLFSRDAKIVVGCATGVRSLRAAKLLAAAGFTDVVDQRAGIDGARGPFGNLVEPGWSDAGLPVTSGADAGSFAELQGKADAARARS
jgi:rhodanese-related sulfurtransferase